MSTAISRDGTPIGYDAAGSGPTVILICGATQYRALDPSLAQLASLLADSFTVVSYDRRGRGESGDTLPYAVEREIEDIAALIAAVGQPAALVGFSSGAVLALEAAKTLPVAKVIAYEPPLSVEGRSFPAGYTERLRDLHAARDGEGAYEHFLNAAIGVPSDYIAGMKQDPSWAAFSKAGITIYYDALVMGDSVDGAPPTAMRWGSVKRPVLVANGDSSFPFMAEAADAVAKALPNASRKTLAGQGHGPSPEVFAPVIREYLADLR